MDEYNENYRQMLTRGCIREISKTELDSWKGGVNYISHHGVVKDTSTTTPLRIVSNSSLINNKSGYSYNSLLAMGPNSISPLLSVLTTFRSYACIVCWDLSKAYNSICTTDRELHYRRLLWRWGQEEAEWTIYGFCKVHFGDVPPLQLHWKSPRIW